MNAKERLTEAVEAMRNISGVSAADWRASYPSFHLALEAPIGFSGSGWNVRLQNMQLELQLRTAEYLLEKDEPKTATVEVSGGVAEVTFESPGGTVEIIDHDDIEAEKEKRRGA